MPWFDYLALDAGGRQRAGSLQAQSEGDARRQLDARRLVPVTLEVSSGSGTTAAGWRPRGFGGRELALFTRQLATLVEVAPLDEALRTIGSQAEKRGVRATVLGVHAGILEGQRLSEAMARQGRAFPPLYRAMVAAGEGSGALPRILMRLADLLENQQQMRARMTTALIYPAVLAMVATGVVIALMTWVVPRVVEQFDSMGQALPLLTRIVIALSGVMAHWGWLMLLAMVLGGLGAGLALRQPQLRLGFDGWLLRLPGIGRLIRDVHAARLARTLTVMLDSGLPLMEGLQASARTVGNRVLRQATEDMANAIREGSSLSQAMRRAGVFPPILLYMAASGESSGRLGPMLERAADYLEREFNTFTGVVLSLLEPAIIVVMGAVVALIVLSILLPILQFNAMVGR